jgi:hypothetical protein
MEENKILALFLAVALLIGLFFFIKNMKKKEKENLKSRKKKNDETYESLDSSEEENKSLNFHFDTSAYPESTIKDINDLDDEKKKQAMDITIFIDKDGYFDETRGQAKLITQGLDFFSKVKGIEIDELNFDLFSFSKISDEFPPLTDEDGGWHVKGGTKIVKYFSENNFRSSLEKLLEENYMDEEDAQIIVKNNMIVSEIYEGDGFNIEIFLGKYNGVNEESGEIEIETPENEDVTRIIHLVTTEELPSKGIGYVHIEGKGLFSL